MIVHLSTDGCPLHQKMTSPFATHLWTPRWLQAQDGGAESGALKALETSCCDDCCCCSVALISSSNEFLASSFLKVCGSFECSASPQRSVAGGLLQLFWLALTSLDICFHCVFVTLFRAALVSFAMRELPVQKGSRNAIIQWNDVPGQAELRLE